MTSDEPFHLTVDSQSPTRATRSRRRLQFGLRTFVILTIVLGAGIGMVTRQILRANRQREIVSLLLSDGFAVGYDNEETRSQPRYLGWRGLWQDVDFWHNVVWIESPNTPWVKPGTLKMIGELPDLERLELSLPYEDKPAALHPFACRRRLKALSLRGRALQTGDLELIGACRQLMSLEICIGDRSSGELGVIRHLQQLRSLRVDGPLVDESVAAWEQFPRLEELHLDGARHLASKGLADLLRRHPTLRQVELIRLNFTLEICEALRDCRSIERLDLSQSELEDEHLAVLGELPKLSKLDIGHSEVTGTAFDGTGRFPALVELSARGSKIDDSGVALLAKLPKLKNLYLSQTRITDVACDFLGRCDLSKLALSYNPVSERGIGALRNERLEELYLEGTEVSPRVFAAAVDWPHLKILYLSKRAADEAELESVLENPELVRLYATGPISDEFAQRHQARFTLMPSIDPSDYKPPVWAIPLLQSPE